jgi:sec-independent protein translocase protein TatB
MFDIGWGELLVIGIVALVVIGPKELPGVVRMLGQSLTKLRRMASDFQNQFTEAMREAELAELKKDTEKLIEDTSSAVSFNPIEKTGEEMKKAVESSPMPPVVAVAPVTPPENEKSSTETSVDEKPGEGQKA